MLWHDFATGEGGDAVDFFQRATGLSRKATYRKFIELAGGRFPFAPRAARPQPRQADSKPKPTFPNFNKGTAADLQLLADQRNLSVEGLELARERGLLWFATLKDCPAWIVTDSARVNAQARRMDGQEWEHIGAKPRTLPGALASWPIGITESQNSPAIPLCEGGPDLLAAFHFIHCESRESSCAPVAMLGAAQHIHPDALPLFAGKRVRIFGHDDEAGRLAVERWAAQLATVGADVDAFNFVGLWRTDGEPVKDLNDCTSIHADDFESERQLWEVLP
jgi:hypothetical protein